MPNWKKVIVSGSDAALNTLNVTTNFTASGIKYPSTDGIDGQYLKTDGLGNLVFENVSNTAISIKNVSGDTIPKGTPCYITASGVSGNVVGVVPADAGSSSLMPAGVIAGETLADGVEGVGLINGFINGVDTSLFQSGEEVFVAVGGGYTNIAPTGSALIQKLGNVEKVDNTNGSGVITGPGTARSVPNINPGFTWVGNTDWVATATATSSLSVASASVATSASYVNPLTQDVLITGSLNHIGDYTHTGSVYHSGSKILNGVFVQTGSLSISGSTTQIGNNTLLGNTTLSGSIIVSGALGTSDPTVKIYGDTQHSGYIRFDPVTTNIDTSISASYIYVSGSTNDLYFSQNGSGYNNVTRLRWLEGNLYTGLLNGGIITTQSSTVYQVSSGSGLVVDLNASYNDNPYPIVTYVNWSNLSASIAPLSASYDQTFVAIQPDGTIGVSSTPYVNGQIDTQIPVGVVLHNDRSTINGVKTQPKVAYGWKQRSNTFLEAFGPLKLSGLTLSVSGSSTGSLVVGSGTAFQDGANYTVDANDPAYVLDTGTNVSKIYKYRQSGSDWVYDTNAGAGYGAIDPANYSNSGVLTPVPTNNWSIQRVFYFPNSPVKAIVVYYGNAIYTTELNAIANINIEAFTEAPDTAANAVYLGALVVRYNANFNTAASYKIIPGGLFRAVGGSGGGGGTVTQTLSGLSDVSISSPTNGQPLVYNSTSLKWENSSILTASLNGNASTATTASFASTASYVLNAISASYATNSSADDLTLQQVTDNGNTTTNGVNIIGTVGIGTNNPTYQLHVSSSTAALGVYERAGGAALYLEGQLTRGVMGTVGSHPFLIAYNSVETARFTGTSFLVTGSLDVSTSITGSDVKIDGWGSVSASLASINTGSLLTTASVSLNTITFTKGDGSTFPITVDTGSGGGSPFPYTGSAIISGSLEVTGSTNIQGALGISQALIERAEITVSASGLYTIYSAPTSSYKGIFADYTLVSTSPSGNARAGNIMSILSGSQVRYSETRATDIGSTAGTTVQVSLNGGNLDLELDVITVTTTWNLVSLVRTI